MAEDPMSLSPEQVAKAQEYNTKFEGQRWWSHPDLPEPLASLEVGSAEFAAQVAAWQVEEELFEDGMLGPRTWQALVERRLEEEVVKEQSGPQDLGFWVQGAPWPEASVLRDASPRLVGESLDKYLHRMGIRHFAAYELTRLPKWHRNVEPLREDWPNIVPALRLAEILRYELGSHPLVTLSGYRPRRYNVSIGGAKNSQHVRFRALHLSLDAERAENEAQRRRLYEVSARLFSRYGAELKMGLGFYAPERGDRVSLDTGFATRSWNGEHVKGVLGQLGLAYPS
jgi:uncharacterized protein YcbK (DUF882 family)